MSAPKPVIAVAYYSTWGHTAALAEEVIKGAEAAGAIVKPYVIQETLPEEVLTAMHAGSSLHPKYPVLTPNDLTEVNGFVVGAPTRYGRVPAQLSAFFDQCGALWAAGALVGKFVTQFTSVAGQHSGHETTALSTFPFYAHHGLNYVPIGYGCPAIGSLEEIQGGSPYGASTVAASDGSWQPKAIELEIARFQGKYFAEFVGTYVRGKHIAATEAASASAPASTAAPVAAASTIPATTTTTTSGAGLEGYNLGAPIGTATATGTEQEKAVPTESADQSGSDTVAPTPAGETATGTGAGTPAETPAPAVPAGPANGAETTEKAPAAPAAAAAAKPAAAKPATAEKQKKKGGLFASCCGSNGIDE